MLRILSLGAGVQSTTLALMAAHGEIEGPMPSFAIFADTRGEKDATYRHISWLEKELPFPIRKVTRWSEGLAASTIAHYHGSDTGRPFTPPFHYEGGMLPIRCSKEWKTRAIIQELRRTLGYGPGERVDKVAHGVEVWIGFTTDEAHRMKPSEAPWITNRWPLVELRKHRGECATWLLRNNYPIPPRSACVWCPLQTDREFGALESRDFDRAVTFDETIRDGGNGTSGPLYVSRHCKPLREIDFQLAANQPDLFGNECEGMCGV